MSTRTLTVILALITLALAGGAAYIRQDWAPLIIAIPIALVVLVNSRAPK